MPEKVEKTGAALYVEDADLTADFLITTIEDLISNSEKLNNMAQKSSRTN